jgi:5-methylthioadenosine/S-adenosylhomocysteine deaminase
MTAQPVPVDFLFENGVVITMDAQRRIIPNGAVAVKDARIIWIGDANDASGRFVPARRIDLAGKAAAPFNPPSEESMPSGPDVSPS